jgi:phenazine biosynthesis protein phzE
MTAGDLLDRLLARLLDEAADRPPFALLHRPEWDGAGTVEVLVGEVTTPRTLAEIPLPADSGGPGPEVLAVVPYRQIAERGFAGPDDGTPLVALTVTERQRVPLAELRDRLPDVPIDLADGHFDISDERYADTVRRVIADEIGAGEGANFVIKRSFVAQVADRGPAAALTLFGRLLRQERNAYWTFLAYTGDRTLVGASPERHVSVRGGTAVMNPISGTYRYPPSGPSLAGVTEFLADGKEADELYMVVDEELKMMAGVCEPGIRVIGPRLKEMAKLAHTEYFIEGRTGRDPREVLRATLFAPTVTGSPLESAARVIARYEPQGRGYYSGVLALIGRDPDGARTLDSAILIRTADISATGEVRIGVGATLVRHSDPLSEVAETRAKAAGLIAAFRSGPGTGPGSPPRARGFGGHPRVRAALAARNETISGYWLSGDVRGPHRDELAGRRVLVVDAEDTFTAMLGHQLGSLGMDVTVRRYDEAPDADDRYDLVVSGPGPGDPEAADDPKITRLREIIDRLLDRQRPFLAVCLSHQVLSRRLGLGLARRAVPNQGVQHTVDLFGSPERVGFYNTFAAVCGTGWIDAPGIGKVEVGGDPETGEVYALRGPHFASVQFHPESVLTSGGERILGDLVAPILRTSAGVG